MEFLLVKYTGNHNTKQQYEENTHTYRKKQINNHFQHKITNIDKRNNNLTKTEKSNKNNNYKKSHQIIYLCIRIQLVIYIQQRISCSQIRTAPYPFLNTHTRLYMDHHHMKLNAKKEATKKKKTVFFSKRQRQKKITISKTPYNASRPMYGITIM